MKGLTRYFGRIHSYLAVLVCSAFIITEVLPQCSEPKIDGGGQPTFNPDKADYENGDKVNVTCSGILYGSPDIEECLDGYWNTPFLPTCEESSCPVLESPEEVNVNPENSNSLYSVITYSCNGNLYLDGTSIAVCKGTGSWEPAEIPVCSGNCTLPEIYQGQATSNDSILHEGVGIEISCKEGYTLTGSDVVTCHDEQWSPKLGECLAVCLAPVIANSNLTTSNLSIDHGEYLIVACDDGYTSGTGFDVNEPLTCFNGSWDTTVECYENCPDISAPNNGNVYPSIGPFYHNNSLYFNCSDGYTLDGQSSSTCDNGNWSNSSPSCRADCPVPAISNSNQTSPNVTIHHGETVFVVCDEGFSFGYGSDFNGILTCYDGDIDESNTTCYESCLGPDINNSNWANRNDWIEFGGTVVVDCDDNYTSGSGSDVNVTLSCGDAGAWNQNVSCYENCPDLTYILPDDVTAFPYPPPFFHKNSVFLNCTDDTYVQVGASHTECLDGRWSDDVPECKASCSSPVIPHSNYGMVSEEVVTHADFIVIVCDDEFTSGTGEEVNETLYCDDGSWNRTVSCYENCDNPEVPVNGSATYDPPNYHGNKVDFSCDSNYTLDGVQFQTCQNGSWSGDTPACKADCGDPGTPAYGIQVYADYRHGGNVTFSCESGYDILGSETIYCEDGEWLDQIPTCEEQALVDQIILACGYDSFTVEIPTALLTDLNASDIVLFNTSCAGILADNGTVVSVTSKLDKCGTQRTPDTVGAGEEAKYYDVYTNRVVSAPSSTIARSVEVDLPLKCTYARETTLNVTYKLTDYTISRNLTEDGAYRFLFAIYDSTFNNVVSAMPYYVGLNEEVHLGISLLSTGAELRVTAETCWATPTAIPSDSQRWGLIKDRCAEDETIDITSDVSRSLFSVKSFRFLEHDGPIYIHCDVLVCERNAEECSFPNEECPVRRRRRSAPRPRHKRVKRLRAGPIRWVNTAYQQPMLQQNKEMSASPNDSPVFYKITISTLGGACVILMSSLVFVTARLVRRDKQIRENNQP